MLQLDQLIFQNMLMVFAVLYLRHQFMFLSLKFLLILVHYIFKSLQLIVHPALESRVLNILFLY